MVSSIFRWWPHLCDLHPGTAYQILNHVAPEFYHTIYWKRRLLWFKHVCGKVNCVILFAQFPFYSLRKDGLKSHPPARNFNQHKHIIIYSYQSCTIFRRPNVALAKGTWNTSYSRSAENMHSKIEWNSMKRRVLYLISNIDLDLRLTLQPRCILMVPHANR